MCTWKRGGLIYYACLLSVLDTMSHAELRQRNGTSAASREAASTAVPSLRKSSQRSQTLRQKVHSFFHGDSVAAQRFEVVLCCLIFGNLACFIISTEPALPASMQQMFFVVEATTALLFSTEYCLRLWSCIEGSITRSQWIWSAWSLMDLASILPFYVDLLVPQDLPSLQFIRILRVFRILRAEGNYLGVRTQCARLVALTLRHVLIGVHGSISSPTCFHIGTFYIFERILADNRQDKPLTMHHGTSPLTMHHGTSQHPSSGPSHECAHATMVAESTIAWPYTCHYGG